MRNSQLALLVAVLLLAGAPPALAQVCDPDHDCISMCEEGGQLAANVPYPEGDESNCENASLIRTAWEACEIELAQQSPDTYDRAAYAVSLIQDYSSNKCKAQ